VNRRLTGRRGRPVRYVSMEVIRGLYGQGYSFRAISLTTGIGYGTVRRAFHGLAPAGADKKERGRSLPVAITAKSGSRRKTAAAA
jgi:transposase